MKKIREQLFCDFCEAEIKERTNEGHATILGKDCCRACLLKTHQEVDEAWHRMVRGEVPDRRGGWRRLGDFADT